MEEKIVKALRMRIYPTTEQEKRIDNTLDCCRFVYNHMLARNEKLYKRRGEHLNYNSVPDARWFRGACLPLRLTVKNGS